MYKIFPADVTIKHGLIIYFINIKSKMKNMLSKKTIKNTLKLLIFKEKPLIAYWWTGDGGRNWGDSLNPFLIEHLSGKKPILSKEIINFKNQNVYSVVGSILGNSSTKNLVVWGSGFISSTSLFKVKPIKICAVRGPLTRELIINQGIDCPKIYGDPALLYPLFYKPNVKKEYRLGVIPHHVDQSSELVNIFKNNPDVLVINILSGINEVVDDICKCEVIASSSLHGIIAADAYGIPSIWIEFSENVVGSGFKFYDYFESVGRINERPFRITENTMIQDIHSEYKDYKIDIDLGKLLDVCPFLNTTEVDGLKKRLNN
ncbi:hypothetical protein EO98_04590 [Methanosarcina sp. 2.H.T.1A.6]|uniref:polysaccharide pyruvyl transferase family protein n=1 Tax=unclassified Methanosarcina TaxID=2644672 RepID=UPI0006229C3A|nr:MULTISPECIES: polysaccharide pyruvyl transferase family protein [unclassified Methanosarcina]KKG11617.1 hypothetical protein EO97_16260 [Methanosarcina sp. 2.H.T.1A.15]KKG15986.1 hypothetical protein EO94_05040 [Methanosarcina sp. 2.H.T.1A.3]KKG21008.1 hypothetical protein EO96_06965 [Methanosarcina sp. 2.H.T.1A.8]KKG21265.1 hypothetical protein EO98_04590 [Methanosarcina sp. 2.H.T.1A.6]